MARKRWSDLSDRERAAVVVMASVQLALATTAWIDLARRPPELVRGPKAAWALGIAVNFAGPIAYFAVGRVRAPAGSGSLPEPNPVTAT
jgi:Phospholipase_D-nuclease N-terminal